jgi:ubiquinone/menaquinone biosynthesis C-methylase UbiE
VSIEQKTLDVRNTAVEHHDREVGTFVEWYEQLKKNRFSNAFSYGRYKIDLVLDEMLKALPRGARVLDVGCGTGEYVARVTELGFEAAGLEPAQGMRERAVEKNPGGDIRDGVATSLPWPDGHFDLVLCIEVLRYLHRADLRAALGEMCRVLKPGGRMFLTMVNRYALDGFWLHYKLKRLARLGRVTTDAPHCEFVTPAEINSELLRAGFSHVESRGVLFAPMRLVYKVSNRLGAFIAKHAEPIDDAICRVPATVCFAGHLIVLGTKSRDAGPG